MKFLRKISCSWRSKRFKKQPETILGGFFFKLQSIKAPNFKLG